MSPVLILLFLFILVPLAEIGVFIEVGGALGLWPTLALTVLTAVIGTYCIRLQGFSLINRARAQLEAGEAPVFEMVSGACLVVAGILLLVPGFVTDTVGFLLLLPPVRRLLFDKVLKPRMTVVAEGQAAARGRRPGGHGASPRAPARPVVIEGEFEEMGESKGEMPPPRGGWDKPR
jgi:UPF0716 protein FxsA